MHINERVCIKSGSLVIYLTKSLPRSVCRYFLYPNQIDSGEIATPTYRHIPMHFHNSYLHDIWQRCRSSQEVHARITFTSWMSFVWATLSQFQKTNAMIMHVDIVCLNFFGGGEPRCCHCMLCSFDLGSKWGTHTSPRVMTCQKPFWFMLKMCLNPKEIFSLINFWNSPCRKLAHMEDVRLTALAICWMVTLPSFITIQTSTRRLIATSLWWPYSGSSSVMVLPHLNSAVQFFTVEYDG